MNPVAGIIYRRLMTRDMKRIQAPQDCTLLLFYFPRTPEACALGLIEGRIRKMFFWKPQAS